MSRSTSVRSLASLAVALGLLCFLPSRSFGKETARAIGSLTPDQRNHLPDDTKVTLPWRGTVTLGTLREEHRARLERFSRAGVWGQHVADRIPKPNLQSSAMATSAVQNPSAIAPGPQNFNVNRSGGQVNFGDGQQGRAPAQQKQNTVVGQGVATIQNSSALGSTGGASKASTTSAAQPQQKQGGGTGGNGLGGGISNSGSSGGATNHGVATIQNSSALGPSNGSSKASATSAAQPQQTPGVGPGGNEFRSGNGHESGIGGSRSATNAVVPTSLFLVPLQKYKGPIPVDYSLFCDAAKASACIYLPPSTTFASPRSGSLLQGLQGIDQALQGQVNQFVADIDPLITDAATCASYGGKLDGLQQCEFLYPFVEQTKFKPNGTSSSAVYCAPPSSYQLDAKGGSITATYPLPYSYPTVATGGTPVTCVVQEWIYP